MEKSNVNNLNGVPNFGHGTEEVVPTPAPSSSLDEVEVVLEPEEVMEKPHKAKVRSAAQKALGGKY